MDTEHSNKKKSKLNQFCLCIIIIAFAAIIVSALIKGYYGKNTSIASKYIDNIPKENAEKIDSILNGCEIENIEKFEHDTALDNRHSKGEKGYRIDMKDTSGHAFLYIKKNNDVHSVVYKNYVLYKNNKQLYTMKDFTFTRDERVDWSVLCEEEVEKVLKSPSTADFANLNDWYFEKTKKNIIIKGYVDSQNSFGAETRSNFKFVVDKKTNTVTSFTMDGNEML